MGDTATCRRCVSPMQPGIAIAQTPTGTGDFHDRDAVVTLSPGGPGRVILCMRCKECGHSYEGGGDE